MKATVTLEEADMQAALREYFAKRNMTLQAVYYRRYHDKQSKDKATHIVAKCDVEMRSEQTPEPGVED